MAGVFTQFSRMSLQSVRRGVRTLLSIPKTQKAVVFDTHKGPLVYKDVPVPVPNANQILINVKYTGVCQTDLHAWEGDWPLPTKLPLIGGHEGAGVVVAKGENVINFEIGDNAGIKWLNSTCLVCEYCQDGNEAICPHQQISGYTVDGSFQQYALADASQAAKIPFGTDLAGVSPLMCAGVTVFKGLKRAELKPGSWVTVTGAGGGLGSLAVQYASSMGYRVLGIDGGAEKGEYVKSLGADEYVDFTTSKDVVKEIIEKTSGGSHGVLVVASSTGLVKQAIEYVRPAGKIILIGVPHGDGFVESGIFKLPS